jgi:hypothetical protein
MLLALGLSWCGGKAAAETHIDAGLSLIAGLERPPDFDQFRQAWSKVTPADCRRYLSALSDALAGQRLTQTSTLHLSQDALGRFRLGLPDVDLTIAWTASALLRIWARWLRQFANSSIPYLLDNFICRRGRVSLTDDTLVVELDRKPLDIILEMAGYTASLERVSWLGQRSVHFQMRGD